MHFKFVYAFNVYAFHMMCERGPKKIGKNDTCVCILCVCMCMPFI